jgi:hypothetical protein
LEEFQSGDDDLTGADGDTAQFVRVTLVRELAVLRKHPSACDDEGGARDDHRTDEQDNVAGREAKPGGPLTEEHGNWILQPRRIGLSWNRQAIAHGVDSFRRMAQNSSFDVTTGVDLQEVDNAINQAQKELAQRYDFKGSKATLEFMKAEAMLVLVADNDFQMRALFDIVQTRLIKRHVSVKNLDLGEIKPAGNDTVRREIKLKTALDGETAKKVAATIKEAKLKKVQASIQGDQVRVSSPSKDDLQGAMALLRSKEFEVELKFGNFR